MASVGIHMTECLDTLIYQYSSTLIVKMLVEVMLSFILPCLK